jgi:SAM-dependent methyltransferase
MADRAVIQRLNLGCGYQDTPNWTHVDVRDYGHNAVADVLAGLPYAADTFDYAVLNHTLQMFSYEEHPVVLAELKRVLKPGGVVRILVPDLTSALLAFQNEDRSYFPIAADLEPTLSGAFARYLFWHGDTRSAFDDESLPLLLQRNGFGSYHGSAELWGDAERVSRDHPAGQS